jgi:hypothetical protein
MNSSEVRQGDLFRRGTKNGEDYIEHEFSFEPNVEEIKQEEKPEIKKDYKKGDIKPAKKLTGRASKPILGAYCIITVKRNGIVSKIVEWADFDRYNKSWNVWGTHPEEMIKKVAEIHAAKKVTNISGIYAEEEFEIIENDKNEKIVQTGDTIGVGKTRKDMLRQLQAQKKLSKYKKK